MKFKIGIFIIAVIILVIGIYLTFNQIKTESYEIVEEDTLTVELTPKILFGLKKNEFNLISEKVEPGQTVGKILNQAGITNQEIEKLVAASKDIFDVRSIRMGNSYHLFYSMDSLKKLEHFVYQIDKINYIRFDFTDSLQLIKAQRKVENDTLSISGVVNSSLWNSIYDAGANPFLAMHLADIYAWTIDFYGLQKGDSFKVVYVVQSIDSVFIGIDKIVAAKFNHSSRDFYAFYFIQDEKGDYFDEKGESLRRAFLKAPLKFSRISSRFSNSRYHPVLKIRRPHHGVDYAAPTGTPVMAIGDGKVISAGWSGGYGKRVVIKHNSTFTTGYAHLSRFGKNIKAGTFVKQGEIIGYVGSTGLATGPHLDFRFYKNDVPIDPLTVESPPAVPVKENTMSDYNEMVKKWMAKLK